MRLSLRVYRELLALYPEDLRGAFGEDILAAFREDLECAWRARGVLGKAAVWWQAAIEVATIAIPRRLANPALSAKAVSVAVHIAVLGGILALGAVREVLPGHIWHGVVELGIRP